MMINEYTISDWQELMEMEKPTAEQRRRDLEKEIGTFEDCLLEWLEK